MKFTGVPMHQEKSLRTVVFFAMGLTLVLFLLGHVELAAGLLVGSIVGLFNYWLMYDAIKKGQDMDSKEANKLFLKRYMLRMLVAITALFLGFQVGPAFVLGIMGGLFLHLFTYIDEVWQAFRKNK